jgi:hypothetical protein
MKARRLVHPLSPIPSRQFRECLQPRRMVRQCLQTTSQQYMSNVFGPSYSPAQNQEMWGTLGPIQRGPTDTGLVTGTLAMPLTQAIQDPFAQSNPSNYKPVTPKPYYPSPFPTNMPRAEQRGNELQVSADQRASALAGYLFPDVLPTDAGATGGGGGYAPGYGYGGGGGGYDYSKAPYAWMSKLLNWNANRS